MRAHIAELSAASARFLELWRRADVGYRLGIHHMRHPDVGFHTEGYLASSHLVYAYLNTSNKIQVDTVNPWLGGFRAVWR
jgi:hypothetical protein